jgi:hypothetical protein
LRTEEKKAKVGNITLTCVIPMFLMNLINKKKDPMVEQVFLIHKDGRLISYASLNGKEHLDEDIVGGMLTAVMDLLTDAFVKKGEPRKEIELYRFEFGEKNIILDRGNNFFIAVVFTGKENEILLDKVEVKINEIEERYGDVFIEWKGSMADFKEADEIILDLLSLEELSETDREKIKDEGLLSKARDFWTNIYQEYLSD